MVSVQISPNCDYYVYAVLIDNSSYNAGFLRDVCNIHKIDNNMDD